jgi:uncharacterized protein (TIGR00369 family)
MTESIPAATFPGGDMRQQSEHLFAQLPFYDVSASDGCLVVELHNRPDLTNTRGALQGGLVATLIDVTAGRLAMDHIPAGHAVATADMTVHFLAPIIEGPARACATIVRAGRRLVVVAVDVADVAADRCAARATLTFAVLDPR